MKKTIIFTLLCFAISIAAAAGFYFSGLQYDSPIGSLFASAYMFIPLLSVWITSLLSKDKPFAGCGIKFKINRWWFVAWLGMPLLSFVVVLASSLMPGVDFSLHTDLMNLSIESFAEKGLSISPWAVIGISLLSALMASITINCLFAFGEEVAWRGFLAHELHTLGFWKKSILIGIIWGFWHAPLILMGHNYPSHPVLGIFMMVGMCVLVSPILMYLRERSGSVIAAAIAHGAINATAGLAVVLLSGFDELLCGFTGLAGFAVMLTLNIIIALTYRLKSNNPTPKQPSN